jgi:hypothetical protein
MSTTSRRVTTSRHRVTLAAGAILAGAVIPIAAAGTAWADETETVSQLEHQGLSASEAKAVFNAEQPTATFKDPTGGTAVEVSYQGNLVVDANNTGTTTAESGATKDVAVAIGADSIAAAGAGADGVSLNGNDDKAFANGVGATAQSGAGNTDTASATGKDSNAFAAIGSHDSSTANGLGAEASSGGSTITSGGITTIDTLGDYDKAIANGAGNIAFAGSSTPVTSSHDTATVTGTNSFAQAVEGSDDTAKIVNGNSSSAQAGDVAEADTSGTTAFNDDHATVIVGHDGTGGGAFATEHSGQTVIVHVPAAMTFISPPIEVHPMPLPLP